MIGFVRSAGDGKAHDVTALARPPDLLEASFGEGVDKAHEAVARGIRVYRISFHDGGPIAGGMIDGRKQQISC